MSATSAEALTAIINSLEVEHNDRWDEEAEIARRKSELQDRRRKLINDEFNRKLDMDIYLQEKLAAAGASNRWRLYRSLTEFEELVRERYKLTAKQIFDFSDDLEDLIDANIPGLSILEREFDIDSQDTARIILRILYADDWKKFIDDFWVRMDVETLLK